MNPFNLPRPATPFAKMTNTDDEGTDSSSCQSSYHEASLSILFDSFHDAISGFESAVSVVPILSPGASSWRPRPSTLSSSPRGSDIDIERAPRLRRVGTLSTSPAGSAYSEISVTVGNAGFEAAPRGSDTFKAFRCSSTTPPLFDAPQTPAADWDGIVIPRILNRKRKQENLRLEYLASQITDSDSDRSSHEDATFESATQMNINKTKLRTAIPAKDSAIWQHDVFCICGCCSHPAHGEMSECIACDQWYHLRCVGVEHLNEHYKNKPFYCPRCMEIGVVETAVAEGN